MKDIIFDEIESALKQNLESLLKAKPSEISDTEFFSIVLRDLLKMKIARESLTSRKRTIKGRVETTFNTIISYPYFKEVHLQAYLLEDGKRKSEPLITAPSELKDIKLEDSSSVQLAGLVDIIIQPNKILGGYENWLLTHYMDTLALQVQNAAEYERAALKDDMTGLFNKSAFNEFLITNYEAEMQKPTDGLSLIVLDADGLKPTNDNHELHHTAGDILLKGIANVIKKTLSKSRDTVCRTGGDEYTVLMQRTKLKTALGKAETIRKNIETHSFIPSRDDEELGYLREDFISGKYPEIKSTVSIGVAHTDYVEDPKDLFDFAEKAMYKSKNTGKNKVSCLHPY